MREAVGTEEAVGTSHLDKHAGELLRAQGRFAFINSSNGAWMALWPMSAL